MKRTVLLFAALAALIAGCGSGKTPYSPALFGGIVATPTPGPTAPPSTGGTVFPDFNITAASVNTLPTLGADGTLSVTLTVRGTKTLTDPVTLSLKNPPAGVTATFSPASVTPTSAGVPVVATIRAADPSKSGSATILGRSGTVERTASVFYNPFVAPSGFSIAIQRVEGQSDGSRVRQFDVTVAQTTGSGEFSLDVDRSDRTGDSSSPVIPLATPAATSFIGLPLSTALAAGETSKTFRLTVTLPDGTVNFYYGFGVNAERGGKKERASVAFLYSGESQFNVSANASVVGLTDTVKIAYTPRNATFAGTLTVDRAADGTLGGDLVALPAGTVVTGLPQTLTFDGTGAARTATFTVTAPPGTSTTTHFGIRVRAATSGSDGSTEIVPLLQFFGGQG